MGNFNEAVFDIKSLKRLKRKTLWNQIPDKCSCVSKPQRRQRGFQKAVAKINNETLSNRGM